MDPVTALALFLQWYPVAVVVAGAVTAATPTPKDDGILRKLRKVLDVIAFNFGHARNGPRG